MMRPLQLAVFASLLALAGCASAPTQYHTLVPLAVAPDAAPAGFVIEVLPVSVPPQVDQPQLVLRQGPTGVVMLDDQRWVAPLADEIRGALSADLATQLNTHDVFGLTSPKDTRSLKIKVDVRRFDSRLGGDATIEASWTIRGGNGDPGAVLACSSAVTEPAGDGYDNLVQAHQRALATLAGRIATAARGVAAGATASCPR
jgi:uncharacterized lipoprotein YmbA